MPEYRKRGSWRAIYIDKKKSGMFGAAEMFGLHINRVQQAIYTPSGEYIEDESYVLRDSLAGEYVVMKAYEFESEYELIGEHELARS